MSAGAARLDRLEAIEAVRTLVGRYALGADRRNDPAILQPLFADDAVWEAKGFGRIEGAAQIARHLADIGARQMLWTLHVMGAPCVEIAEGAAQGSCTWNLWELARMRPREDEPAQAHWIGGRYDADVKRTAAGWRFGRVTLELALVSPYAEGWRLIGEAGPIVPSPLGRGPG